MNSDLAEFFSFSVLDSSIIFKLAFFNEKSVFFIFILL